MNRLALLLTLSGLGLMTVAGCRSTPKEPTWRDATVLVLNAGTAAEERIDGEALRTYLREFQPDRRTGFQLVRNTRTGYMVIDGKRHLVTAATVQSDVPREVMTIHVGSSPLHLVQRVR